jgi:hypothetical protein
LLQPGMGTLFMQSIRHLVLTTKVNANAGLAITPIKIIKEKKDVVE